MFTELWKHGWILWTLSFLRTWSSGERSKNVRTTSDLENWEIYWFSTQHVTPNNSSGRSYKANISKQTDVALLMFIAEHLYFLYTESLTFHGMLMAFFNSLSTSFSLVSMSLASLICTSPTNRKHNNIIF